MENFRRAVLFREAFPKLALFVFVMLVVCPGLDAAEKPAKSVTEGLVKSDSPLHIASDRMEVMQKERMILFEGHVAIRLDDLSISAGRMRVFGAASGKEKGKEKDPQNAMMEKIDRIEVEGDVKIAQRDKLATSDKAVYYHQDRKIVLMGRPVVSQGRDKVQGRLITLYIDEGKSVVEGGDETPVQAVLHPSRKEEGR